MNLVDLIFIQPVINVLFFFYSLIPSHDFGLAVILLTLVIRFALWPIASKGLHSQKAMQMIQPDIEKLKKKHKDPQQLSKALMELYKEKEVSPFGSCLPALIQIPFMLALFWTLIKLKDPSFIQIKDSVAGIPHFLYESVRNISFVKETINTETVLNTKLFNTIDLAKPSLILAVLAGIGQFIQSKMIMPKNQAEMGQQQKMMNRMILFFPALTVVFGAILPGALPLYWFVMTLVAILQQYLVMHRDIEYMEHLRGTKK